MHAELRTREALGPFGPIEEKNAPDVLYTAGDIALLTEGSRVAIVGSRKATPDGIKRAQAVTRALVQQGIIVVSGLAEGIDTVAHRTAIDEGGRTIAVLGTPLSKAYPAKNAGLLEEIKRHHLAISQFPEGYPGKSENFPRRNRTMALICDATIVIEASEKSGTRHQGWEAIRLGRDLYLLDNVATNPNLTWPKQLIEYGAQVLRREDLPDILLDIPNYTAGGVRAFEL
ncbi:DNA-protecting protein DprA [Sulfitobacter sp. M57]|nr:MULTISPECIES: DNA-processing protein DprA [unclassified Sulfitobacter]MDF3476278.1 DNA-protecting protein DprA [Sulfitobacter sp. M48]MDF3484096.1 DNA-protecting protein DprA [Sulfitobacter sp. M24]MDF3491887.1 DNA-protecting protein DprA [Sulfitobacter sp. M60]MDF3507500.1 DNA-protecting protein DprA [Sulfitobacter sp. M54]MDF3530905.1 DNA-protecting protein DprA [Sulfitobacter sp. M77]MDF3538719.1 DNA-protecting protein DprA [Sulfitobacter sp. M71]